MTGKPVRLLLAGCLWLLGKGGGHRPGPGGHYGTLPRGGGCGRCCPWWCSRWRTPLPFWPGRETRRLRWDTQDRRPLHQALSLRTWLTLAGVTAAAPLAGGHRLDPPQTGWPWCGPAWGRPAGGGRAVSLWRSGEKSDGGDDGYPPGGWGFDRLGAQRPVGTPTRRGPRLGAFWTGAGWALRRGAPRRPAGEPGFLWKKAGGEHQGGRGSSSLTHLFWLGGPCGGLLFAWPAGPNPTSVTARPPPAGRAGGGGFADGKH